MHHQQAAQPVAACGDADVFILRIEQQVSRLYDDFLGGAAVSLTPEELEEFEWEYGGITLMGHRADAFTESQIDK